MKGIYDNKFNCKLKSLKVGDFVLVRNEYPSSKIENRWLEIPHKIISRDDKSIPVYKVKNSIDQAIELKHQLLLIYIFCQETDSISSCSECSTCESERMK